MTAHPPPRVAIYARVSTDNQMSGEEGSLATQEATLRAAAAIKFGDDATIRVFREEAASGKSLDRPALQRLLKAVERDEIDHVMVTRIDRVSRSLVDFMNLHATFEAAKVGFHSIKDSFDTSGAFGMAMLQILLVFAQLERAQTAERTSTAMQARAERGLWNGGPPPLGYDPQGAGKLEVNQAEVAVVREAFELMLTLRSTRKVTKALNDRGHRQKQFRSRRRGATGGRLFTQSVVSHLLRSRLYLGEVRNNSEWFAGRHDAILDPVLFARVQEILDANSKGNKPTTDTQPLPYLLTGLLRCGHCDLALTTASARGNGGRRHRYYRCTSTTKRAETDCPTRSFPADQLEQMVLAIVRKAATSPDIVQEAAEEAQRLFREEITPSRQRLAALRVELSRVREQQERLLDQLLESGVAASRVAKRRLQELETREDALATTAAEEEGRLAVSETAQLDHEVLLEALRTFDRVFDALSGDEQKDLLQQMLHRVVVWPDRVSIALYDGNDVLLRMEGKKPRAGMAAKLTPVQVQNGEEAGSNSSRPLVSPGDPGGVNPRFVYRVEWLPVAHLTAASRS